MAGYQTERSNISGCPGLSLAGCSVCPAWTLASKCRRRRGSPSAILAIALLAVAHDGPKAHPNRTGTEKDDAPPQDGAPQPLET